VYKSFESIRSEGMATRLLLFSFSEIVSQALITTLNVGNPTSICNGCCNDKHLH